MVDRFCCLGDVVDSGEGLGGVGASQAGVACAWAEFRELLRILAEGGMLLGIKGGLCSAWMQGVFV